MNEKLIFECSKEGFESRFESIESTYKESVFTKEEYDDFRESELNEILFSKGSSNLLRWVMVSFLVLSILFLSYGLSNHNTGIVYTSLPALLVTLFFWHNSIKPKKSKSIITIGGRQEVIDHLLNIKTISTDKAKFLNMELVNIISK